MIYIADDENKKETEKALNQLAREEMKLRLLADIAADLQVCKMTGGDPKGYLLELKELIDSILKEFK